MMIWDLRKYVKHYSPLCSVCPSAEENTKSHSFSCLNTVTPVQIQAPERQKGSTDGKMNNLYIHTKK